MHQRQGWLDALRDHGEDRQVGEDRLAEIALQDLPDPFAEPALEHLVTIERPLGKAARIGGDRLAPLR
jgi:hypothetical protein